jgi:hypothetical protein
MIPFFLCGQQPPSTDGLINSMKLQAGKLSEERASHAMTVAGFAGSVAGNLVRQLRRRQAFCGLVSWVAVFSEGFWFVDFLVFFTFFAFLVVVSWSFLIHLIGL